MMRKIALPLTLLGAAMLAPPLQAADGNINVTGRVVENACLLDAGSKNQTVNLGMIDGRGGRWGGSWHFDIVLRDCPASSSQVKVRFEGTHARPGETGEWDRVFAPNNSGTPGAAKNVGFLIGVYPVGGGTGYLIEPNGLTETYYLKTGPGSENKLGGWTGFYAGYSSINKDEPIGYGVATADVQFSIVYP
ncbi:fimbrial protein [Serratia marcescens]|uniref:fimbrial protein n=1 Tax=Serratia marcescens TaxID=615 RepID=UPI0011AEE410|nr:fimbrial protein [Serratia marcescens]WLS87178.1 fimbrial protein [Serratia marcescens]